jgi:hypothetical protein
MGFFDSANFDATKVAPSTGFQPLPDGDYKVLVKKCAEQPTKDGTGRLLKCELSVIDGKYKGRTVFWNINLINKSAEAQAIGQAQLSGLCRAVGIPNPKNAGQFANKILTVKVKVQKRKDTGEMQNQVAGAVLPEVTPADQAKAETAESAAPDSAPWA